MTTSRPKTKRKKTKDRKSPAPPLSASLARIKRSLRKSLGGREYTLGEVFRGPFFRQIPIIFGGPEWGLLYVVQAGKGLKYSQIENFVANWLYGGKPVSVLVLSSRSGLSTLFTAYGKIFVDHKQISPKMLTRPFTLYAEDGSLGEVVARSKRMRNTKEDRVQRMLATLSPNDLPQLSSLINDLIHSIVPGEVFDSRVFSESGRAVLPIFREAIALGNHRLSVAALDVLARSAPFLSESLNIEMATKLVDALSNHRLSIDLIERISSLLLYAGKKIEPQKFKAITGRLRAGSSLQSDVPPSLRKLLKSE